MDENLHVSDDNTLGNTPEEERAVRICYDWFEKDREAKQFYMDEMEEMWKLYKGDHWDLIGADGNALRTDTQKKSRPNSVENVTFSLVEGFVAEFSQDVDIIDIPVEQGDEEAANIMTDVKKFIQYKNRISRERINWLRNFFLYGTGIWHAFWDPTWRGGRGPNRWEGEIRWQSVHPQAIFPDCRCKTDINEGNRIHKARYVTLEYIREHYPERGGQVREDVVNADMLIGEYDEETASGSNEEQALLVETWYIGEPMILGIDENGQKEENRGKGLHIVWWAADSNFVYLKHANYVYFEPDEDIKFPFIFSQCYNRENSVWGFGEAYFLKSPQIAVNKTSELIIEGHMHHALGQTWYEETAITPKQKKIIEKYGTLPGMWFPVQDANKIKREYGHGVPASLQSEMARLQKVMETIVGRFDISQGRTPSNVTAFRALDLLAARAQVRMRSKEMAMTTAYEDVGNYINLIVKHYTERRVYRILGEQDSDEPKYGMFDLASMQKVFIYDTGQVMPATEFIPMEGMVEGENFEIYSPEFDVICKVSTTLPTDRLFYMEMAKELYAGQVIDGEVFWYVMQNGKFPPFEEMMQKEQEKKMMAQMQAGMMSGVPGAMPGNMPPEVMPPVAPPEAPPGAEMPAVMPPGAQGTPQDMLQDPQVQAMLEVLQKRPDLAEKLAAIPAEERRQRIAQIMEAGIGSIA